MRTKVSSSQQVRAWMDRWNGTFEWIFRLLATTFLAVLSFIGVRLWDEAATAKEIALEVRSSIQVIEAKHQATNAATLMLSHALENLTAAIEQNTINLATTTQAIRDMQRRLSLLENHRQGQEQD